jgi:hypothetical protein
MLSRCCEGMRFQLATIMLSQRRGSMAPVDSHWTEPYPPTASSTAVATSSRWASVSSG